MQVHNLDDVGTRGIKYQTNKKAEVDWSQRLRFQKEVNRQACREWFYRTNYS